MNRNKKQARKRPLKLYRRKAFMRRVANNLINAPDAVTKYLTWEYYHLTGKAGFGI